MIEMFIVVVVIQIGGQVVIQLQNYQQIHLMNQ